MYYINLDIHCNDVSLRGEGKKNQHSDSIFCNRFPWHVDIFSTNLLRSDSYRNDVPLEISMRRHRHNGPTSNSRQMKQNTRPIYMVDIIFPSRVGSFTV